MKKFQDALSNKRKELGLSMEQLADLAGLSRGYINNLEKGTRLPTSSTIIKLSKALNIPTDEIASWHTTNNESPNANSHQSSNIELDQVIIEYFNFISSTNRNTSIQDLTETDLENMMVVFMHRYRDKISKKTLRELKNTLLSAPESIRIILWNTFKICYSQYRLHENDRNILGVSDLCAKACMTHANRHF